MKTFIFIITTAFLMLGCDQRGSVDSTKERAKAEQEAGNDVENKNLAQKAQKMESDLADRHYFYSAVEGQYQGTVDVNGIAFNIKLNIVKSLPIYPGDRVRQLSEIENDLNNLYFHVQIIQWSAEDLNTAVGCRVSQIRPDMVKGALVIASSECANLYTISLSDLVSERMGGVHEKAKNVAEKIRQKQIALVDSLVGTIQPSSNASTYTFSVNRIK